MKQNLYVEFLEQKLSNQKILLETSALKWSEELDKTCENYRTEITKLIDDCDKADYQQIQHKITITEQQRQIDVMKAENCKWKELLEASENKCKAVLKGVKNASMRPITITNQVRPSLIQSIEKTLSQQPKLHNSISTNETHDHSLSIHRLSESGQFESIENFDNNVSLPESPVIKQRRLLNFDRKESTPSVYHTIEPGQIRRPSVVSSSVVISNKKTLIKQALPTLKKPSGRNSQPNAGLDNSVYKVASSARKESMKKMHHWMQRRFQSIDHQPSQKSSLLYKNKRNSYGEISLKQHLPNHSKSQERYRDTEKVYQNQVTSH